MAQEVKEAASLEAACPTLLPRLDSNCKPGSQRIQLQDLIEAPSVCDIVRHSKEHRHIRCPAKADKFLSLPFAYSTFAET
jgi:hypothetical protein